MKAQPNQPWIVRAVACGSVIAGCLEDGFGKPLTKQSAESLAEFENERSERRRAQKLPGAWYYYAEPLERQLEAAIMDSRHGDYGNRDSGD